MRVAWRESARWLHEPHRLPSDFEAGSEATVMEGQVSAAPRAAPTRQAVERTRLKGTSSTRAVAPRLEVVQIPAGRLPACGGRSSNAPAGHRECSHAGGVRSLSKNASGRARTCNLRFRRPMLYPVELHPLGGGDCIAKPGDVKGRDGISRWHKARFYHPRMDECERPFGCQAFICCRFLPIPQTISDLQREGTSL